MIALKFCFLVLFASETYAANWKKSSQDILKVSTGFVVPSYNVELRAPKEISDRKIQFRPNIPSKYYVGLAYRNLGVSGSVNTKLDEEKALNQGSSSGTDFQFRFYGKRTYEFSYQNYSGYYIENSQDVDTNYSGKQKILRPDIVTKNTAFNLFWNFYEDDFSLRVALDQDGQQQTSGWSSFAVIGAADSAILANSPWVPNALAAQFGQVANSKNLQRLTFSGGGGVGGIFSMADFYLSAVIIIGVSYQNLSYDQNNTTTNETQNIKTSTTGSFGSFRTSIGYNGEKHVAGFQIIGDSVGTDIYKANISGSTQDVRLFYSYRFDGVNLALLNPISALFD